MTLIIIALIIFIALVSKNNKGASKKTSTKTEQKTQTQTQTQTQQEIEEAKNILLLSYRLSRDKKRIEAEKQAAILIKVEQERQATICREKEQAELQLQNNRAEEALELQLCEENTAYKNSLYLTHTKQRCNFNFNTIRSISVSFINQLPKEIKEKLHRELNSGVSILMTENHLHAYNFAFGNMHQAKLKEAFEACQKNNHFNLSGKKVEVIDYGCGQGIGTVTLIDFFKFNKINCIIEKVKLIEPSTLAIKRASLNIRYSLRNFNQNENVFAINKAIDDLSEINLKTKDSTIKIHLLSNIIDVEGFELSKLCKKISLTQIGVNIFICISPKFWQNSVHIRNLRLDNFLAHFQQNHQTTTISQRDTDIGKWKRYEKVFSVEIPISTS